MRCPDHPLNAWSHLGVLFGEAEGVWPGLSLKAGFATHAISSFLSLGCPQLPVPVALPVFCQRGLFDPNKLFLHQASLDMMSCESNGKGAKRGGWDREVGGGANI